MALMGISLAAGGLLSAAADQRRNSAHSAYLIDKDVDKLDSLEKEANHSTLFNRRFNNDSLMF
ncbi:hypothetical protein D1AOALGA4SA_11914 [Olavius algarvensis Delta 1 endosymbiont]|nr:hypothetical protein D1AOALGA4SA_11914 [Olavius algarvensis Delta 1 endosymbiont]